MNTFPPEASPAALARRLVELGLPPSSADAIAGGARPVRHEAGTLIEQRGAPARAVWFLAEGVVSHQVRLRRDAPAVLSLYGPGTLLNHVPALFDAPNGLDTVAMTGVAALAIDLPAYRAWIDREPAFLRAMLRLSAHRSTRLAEALAVLKHGSPALRIVFVLCHFAQAFGPDSGGAAGAASPVGGRGITLPANAAVLASMAGVARSTAAEVIRELGAAGFVGRSARGALRIERREAWLALHRRLLADATLPAHAGCGELVAALRAALPA